MNTSLQPRTTPLVFVVDDDPGMRKSLGKVMDSAQLPHRLYACADEFLREQSTATDGVLVLDLQMPGMHGLELLRRLRGKGVSMPVVVVTGTAAVPSAVEAMKLGAVDLLEKPVDHQTLVQTVRRALDSASATRAQSDEIQAIRRRLSQLTDREREVLDWIVAGLSNKQIAAKLGISIKTVAIHRANLMLKSTATNTADLVRMTMLATAPA